jgi:hypothetical protein
VCPRGSEEGEDGGEDESEVVGTLEGGGGESFKVGHESLGQRTAHLSLDATYRDPPHA